MKIHPTAIVEDGAVLADDVEIGPYALVGPQVSLGAGCRVMGHAVIAGDTKIGERNFVGYGAVIGSPPQDFAWNESVESGTRIGDGNTFREYVTVHRGTAPGSTTVVGDGNFVMAGAHFGHNVRVGNRVIVANNCLLGGYVQVDDAAVLGGGTVFHQFMRVGRLAMVRGGTRFGKDIVPFAIGDEDNVLSGLNSVGLRRAGISSEARMDLKRLFRVIFRSGRNVSQALADVEGREWGAEAREVIAFIRSAKKRGICVTKPSARGDESSDD